MECAEFEPGPCEATESRSVKSKECVGNRACPSTVERWRLPCYEECLGAIILEKLNAGWTPTYIRREIKEIDPGLSDHLILTMIGEVSVYNGFYFGRKIVDRAIRESNIELRLNKRCDEQRIREAFEVYGRGGVARRVSMPPGVRRSLPTAGRKRASIKIVEAFSGSEA